MPESGAASCSEFGLVIEIEERLLGAPLSGYGGNTGTRMNEPDFGLCGGCLFQRVVPTTRGAVYSLCERAAEDPRFARYPPLPVGSCAGFLPRVASADQKQEKYGE